ncbi:GntR family transcriptional regulator [Acidisoma cladoniae]|uniref:GntR family transcriptional regulator n=1 Tax=Acidisoma cladoniae TaxID=3040935 RepID=UPI00254E9B58|nr:GntR family transcriptional regulator [Acidisoma sp. PAMC 29798]
MEEAAFEINLGDSIYRRLSDSLVQGVRRPEERLKIRDIAAQMGTSVTPVRDAVLRLVQERALYLRSPRDIRVRSVSIDEYLEVRAIRVELEGHAAAAAAERATETDIRRLDRLVRDNARALRAGNKALTTDLNQKFHFEIVRIANMPVRADILRRLWLSLGPWITENYAMDSRAMIEFHYAAVDAIRARDPIAARAALRDDLVIGGGVIMDKYLRAEGASAKPAGHGMPIATVTGTK